MKAFPALVVLTSLVGGSSGFMVLPAADTSRGVALRADILSTEDIDFDGTLHGIDCHDFHRTRRDCFTDIDLATAATVNI